MSSLHHADILMDIYEDVLEERPDLSYEEQNNLGSSTYIMGKRFKIMGRSLCYMGTSRRHGIRHGRGNDGGNDNFQSRISKRV